MLRQITDPCDICVCLYVFEVLPTPEDGERVLRLAYQMLAPGGLAPHPDQVRQRPLGQQTPPPRLHLRHLPDDHDPIAEFWQLAERCGFTPEGIELVPENELDTRYAYFFLSK